MVDIGVVLVTFNRLNMLKQTLAKFEEQTCKPKYLIVVNNASNDGTKEYLDKWKELDSGFEKIVVNMETNLGGAGGFAEGLSRSLEKPADWIWVSDDDAFPDREALNEVAKFLDDNRDQWKKISAICGEVINNDVIDCLHRRSMYSDGLKIKTIDSKESDYKKDSFEINCFSYVGTIINKEKMLDVGVTRKDYFIWFDDTEHSLRLSRVGKIICVPKIKIYHNVVSKDEGFTWKNYYGMRNKLDTYKMYLPKKCYYYFLFRRYLRIWRWTLKGKNKEERIMMKCAIRDSKKGNFGINKIYKPGWKNSK